MCGRGGGGHAGAGTYRPHHPFCSKPTCSLAEGRATRQASQLRVRSGLCGQLVTGSGSTPRAARTVGDCGDMGDYRRLQSHLECCFTPDACPPPQVRPLCLPPRVPRRYYRALVTLGARAHHPCAPPFGPAAALNYDGFLTRTSAARQPSAIRALQPLLDIPGMISLGGGMPNPSTFPFASMDVKLTTGETLPIGAKDVRSVVPTPPSFVRSGRRPNSVAGHAQRGVAVLRDARPARPGAAVEECAAGCARPPWCRGQL